MVRAECSSLAQFPALISEYLSGEARGKPLCMQGVGLDESREVVGIGRRDHMKGVFVELKICLFTVAEG